MNDLLLNLKDFNLNTNVFFYRTYKIKFQIEYCTDKMDVIIETFYEEQKERMTDKVNVNSFSLISVIGKGSYAEVILARKKDTGTIYALKILKKSKIEQRNQKSHVKTERNILVLAPHLLIFTLS
jgi:serum/glucocorticoid-regulated kinase 2